MEGRASGETVRLTDVQRPLKRLFCTTPARAQRVTRTSEVRTQSR